MRFSLNRIAVSAGELSGDEHAARLVSSIQALLPNATIKGMGGKNLRARGVDTIVDCEKSGSVMGFGDVLKSAGKIWSAMRSMKELLQSWQPDILILIDYPDFNLRLASFAKSRGIKVFYFIPPSVWAWRSGRTQSIKRFVDGAALIYPFEEAHYRNAGYDNAHFVGHPFCDLERLRPFNPEERAAWRKEHGLNEGATLLTIFPGSRTSEIKKNAALLQGTISLIHASHPEVQIAIAAATSAISQELRQILGTSLSAQIVDNQSIELLKSADAGLLKSGTSNMQAAFTGLPCSMFYRTSPIAAFIARKLIHLKEYSPINLIRGGTVREFVQEEALPENLAQEAESLLFDEARRSNMLAALAEVRQALGFQGSDARFAGSTNAYERAAQLVLNL